MWEFLAKAVPISALIAAVAWVAREAIKHWLDRDIESYRTKLEAAHGAALARMRHDLTLRAVEHEIRFRSMHERQAEVVAETYVRLRDVHVAVAASVSPVQRVGRPQEAERSAEVERAFTEFLAYFPPQQLFLPEVSRDAVQELALELADIVDAWKFVGVHGQITADDQDAGREEIADLKDERRDVLDRIRRRVPGLMRKLEADFKRLLGVSHTLGAPNDPQEEDQGEEEGREPEAPR